MSRLRIQSACRVTLAVLIVPLAPVDCPSWMATPALAVQPVSGQPVATQPEGPTQAEADRLFQQQKYPEAAALYTQIVEREPENATAWFNLGYSLHVMGRLEEALPAHERAADLAPTAQLRGPAIYNIGCANALLGRSDAAFAALVRAVDAGFTNTQLLRQDSDLDSLRDDPRFEEIEIRVKQRALPAAFRQFNFWVGQWEVYNRAGALQGTNRITLEEGGLFLQEHWSNTAGNTGQSVNYYEPVERVWKQVWIDPQGVLETKGTFEDGAMRFRGERKLRTGQTRQHRMAFTALPDGRVRQFIEESNDGETWSVYFDGLYVPAGSPAPGAWTPESLTAEPEGEAGAESGADAGGGAGGGEAGAPDVGALVGLWDMSAGGMELVAGFEVGEGGVLSGFLELDGERITLLDIVRSGESLTMGVVIPSGEEFRFKGTLDGHSMRGAWTGPDGVVLDSTAARRVL